MATAQPVYDSARRAGVREGLATAWRYRELIVLLARRDVARRYERAALGAAWTVLLPLAYAGALWMVFSEVARFAVPGVPFVVYVLSGVVVLTFVGQTVLGAAAVVLQQTVALRRVSVPIGVFVTAHALAALVPLLIATLSLLVVELAAGVSIPWTILLLPFALLALALAASGVGLLVGALSALYEDVLELTRLLLQLAGFIAPVFYPLSIIPHRFHHVVADNPLSRFVALVRNLAYEGVLPSLGTLAICAATVALAIAAGAAAFTLVRRAYPSLL